MRGELGHHGHIVESLSHVELKVVANLRNDTIYVRDRKTEDTSEINPLTPTVYSATLSCLQKCTRVHIVPPSSYHLGVLSLSTLLSAEVMPV